MIEKIFTGFRKVSIISVIASVLGSLLMFIIGAVKVARAYHAYFLEPLDPNTSLSLKAGLAIAYTVQAIDAFLIALILMIFGYGVFILFAADEAARERGWASGFRVSSISELKKILADMIVIILMVKFLEYALVHTGAFDWQMLVLPGAILLLAAAVRLLKMREME